MATGLAPTNELESAILITLPVGEGGYTAIVRGANNTTGVGLVEAYFGNPCLGTIMPVIDLKRRQRIRFSTLHRSAVISALLDLNLPAAIGAR